MLKWGVPWIKEATHVLSHFRCQTWCLLKVMIKRAYLVNMQAPNVELSYAVKWYQTTLLNICTFGELQKGPSKTAKNTVVTSSHHCKNQGFLQVLVLIWDHRTKNTFAYEIPYLQHVSYIHIKFRVGWTQYLRASYKIQIVQDGMAWMETLCSSRNILKEVQYVRFHHIVPTGSQWDSRKMAWSCPPR